MKYRPILPLILLRRVLIFIGSHGLRGVCKRLVRFLRSHGSSGAFIRSFSMLGSAARREQVPKSPKDAIRSQVHPFDLLFGTDTGGYISGENLPAISLSALYSTAYLGIPPSALTQALSALPIRYQDFTFVDIGCGKGRALLIAAQFPFRHLLGVEIADELCDIARANVATSPEWVARISVVNQDATNLTYPEGPLLLYLYYPFYPPVLRRVLANLGA